MMGGTDYSKTAAQAVATRLWEKQSIDIAVLKKDLKNRRSVYVRGDVRETSYLFPRISVTLQCFNSMLLYDTLPVDLPDL